jgi:hypothetical protein
MESINKRQLVKVSHINEYIFRIPPDINLEDKNQVKHWDINSMVLNIELIDGTKLKIKEEWIPQSDFHLYQKTTTEIETYNEKEEI